MNYDEINDKLRAIDYEDFVWVIYIFIIILSWYSNNLERKYFLYNDGYSKDRYQEIMIFIFLVLTSIYYSFFESAINDISNIKESDSNKKKKLTYLSALASLLILISGIIYLYIACNDEELNVEIAFN